MTTEENSTRFLTTLLPRALDAGDKVTILDECFSGPSLDLGDNSGIIVTMRKDDGQIILEGKTYLPGFGMNMSNVARALGDITIPGKDPDAFLAAYDELVEKLLERDAWISPRDKRDKPVDRTRWQTRIDQGRDYGERIMRIAARGAH
ncbi:hypothetical protein V5S96_04955 [Corynebacterium mastitidis]|uniref:Uncharacterized protein n=1 Tax=Corynebacterium mastitidis TaxID=161890 RepID=A0ABU8NXH2_9CORY